MTTKDLLTLLLASYGAILSTIAIIRQLRGDKVKVKLKVGSNWQIQGDVRYEGMNVTTVETVNTGRRPVTITQVSAAYLYPKKYFVAMDSTPRLPYEITESKYITTILDQADVDLEKIDYWQASDSHGRKYKLRVAPLHKHWKSQIQRWWHKKK